VLSKLWWDLRETKVIIANGFEKSLFMRLGTLRNEVGAERQVSAKVLVDLQMKMVCVLR